MCFSDQSWLEAVKWYERSLVQHSDEDDQEYDSTSETYPTHVILAKLAELYRAGQHSLNKDPNRAGIYCTWVTVCITIIQCYVSGDLYNEAAEAAMEAMKGKLANKYFMMAEEAYGEVEEEEE